jgi:D-specific alpha-keto acid dehydrogenase
MPRFQSTRLPQPSALGLTVYGCEPDEAALFDALCPRLGFVATLRRDAVSAANADAAVGSRCVSVGHKSEVSGPTLRALREAGVEYLSTRSVGLDHIDLRVAAELGITVESVVYAPDGVADYTLMLILMAIRDATGTVRAADRHDFRLSASRGKDLRDMTVGVLGLGRIGSAVAKRLHGFGCHVLATGNRPTGAAMAELVSFDELLRESDVVTLHLPLDSDTHHIIGRPQIELMKPGACLVNTGRGALVDTRALVAALETGRLGGAALDVLEGEEGLFYTDCATGPIDNPHLLRLQRLPNVIVTPHTAYYTERTLRDTVDGTLRNCRRFERSRCDETQGRDLVRGLLRGA